jgi:zinc transport system substrate-binding protein
MSLGRADLYFRGSMPFERRLLGKLSGSTGDLTVVDLNEGIQMRHFGETHHHAEHEGNDTGHHEEDKAHEHLDPHTWLSPPALMTQAANVASALRDADPVHSSHYEKRLRQFEQEVDDLHERLKKALAPYAGRAFYVFHPAFGYFARAYGLEQKAVQVEGKSPTPRQLQELIRRARAENVRIIFVQPQFESRSARAVAEAIEGAVVPLDPLARNVIANLEKIAAQVERALGDN